MAALAVGGLVLVGATPVAAAPGGQSAVHAHRICAQGTKEAVRCHSWIVTDAKGKPKSSTSPYGLDPATIKAAYNFPTSPTAGSGKTIAIVDAYDDPTAEADLAKFSGQYGLPSCTAASGCFTKVGQTGNARKLPRVDAGWALEISLDVQWAHAIAPGAKILLVEASSASFTNLLAAEDYAKTHASYVSNSWGANEFSGESIYDGHFKQAGVSFFVSAGDNGTPAEYPSSSPNVVSVGGTTLHLGADPVETAWADGGGGCSAYETATGAQAGYAGTAQQPGYAQVACGTRRATPDVSLDADPASGVSVYDSTAYQGQSGWFQVGGTSASAPMIAGRSAVLGGVVDATYLYTTRPLAGYRDITVGNNGAPCKTGYDLCSGLGSWLG